MKPIEPKNAASHRSCRQESTRPKPAQAFARRTSRLILTALLAFVSALTGAPLPGFVTPASAQETATYEQLKSFGKPSPGGQPMARLVQGRDGALYGTTTQGGIYEAGTVFKVNPDGSGFTVLLHFEWGPFNTSSTGSFTRLAGVIQGIDGALYGTTYQGGRFTHGTVFKINTDGSGFTVLKHFSESPGDSGSPAGGLVQGLDGTLYGTAAGGSNFSGTVFKLNPDGTGFAILKDFDSLITGRGPTGTLVLAADGRLYGTAGSGGTYGYGTAFKLNVNGTGFTVIKHFDNSSTGAFPTGLTQGSDRAFYGTAIRGGSHDYGTVFKLSADENVFTVLKHLDDYETGSFPQCPPMQGADGAVYGTAYYGGSYNGGTLFKVDPNGTSFTVLKSLEWVANGAWPAATLTQGADGAFYGTATDKGPSSADDSSGYGTVFKINRDGSNFTILKELSTRPDLTQSGGNPLADLIQGTDGAFYGTTPSGGTNLWYGTVFKLNADGSGFTVLKNFDRWSGGQPSAPLLEGSDAALYGTASCCGGSDGGTLFKLNLDGSDFLVLKNFDWFETGAHPDAGLTQGTDGALYGTTTYGGTYGFGTAFKVKTDGNDFNVLSHATNWQGGSYSGGSIQGSDGAIYGTVLYGGEDGFGTVYRANPDGSDYTILLDFDFATNGAYPRAKLTEGADGNLYGTTYGGGDAGAGTVFRLVFHKPRITSLTPPSIPSNSGAFILAVDGFLFAQGAVVQWNGADLETTFVSSLKLTAAVPNTPTTSDIYTALITVKNPDGTTSTPKAIVVFAANVAGVESNVAPAGQSVSASTAPAGTGNTAGITATVKNSGDPSPVTVSAAIYKSNPSASTAFAIDSATGIAGEFMDLKVTGADAADTMGAYFYYPTNTTESDTSPTLQYFNGADWVPVLSSGGSAPAKDTTDNLEGTRSGGRFTVNFDSTSTPKITELGGTYFAVTVPRPPLGFTGFLAPVGGADASGGSFAAPLRTFKAGSTIPVKFTISRNGTAVVTGVQRLQAVKYSDATTAATPIDATPQGAATSGNQFELNGGEWHFNLDTKATGLTKGIWQLAATLSDGSQHRVWIQIK